MRQILNLYFISQVENLSEEAFQACIVAEESIVKARETFPMKIKFTLSKQEKENLTERVWTNSENVRVKYIGEAADDMTCGIVLATKNHFHN